jgi:hypothetical protein
VAHPDAARRPPGLSRRYDDVVDRRLDRGPDAKFRAAPASTPRWRAEPAPQDFVGRGSTAVSS